MDAVIANATVNNHVFAVASDTVVARVADNSGIIAFVSDNVMIIAAVNHGITSDVKNAVVTVAAENHNACHAFAVATNGIVARVAVNRDIDSRIGNDVGS